MKSLARFLRGTPRYYLFGGVGIFLVLIVSFHFFTRATVAPEAAPYISHVTLSSVSSLSSQTGPLSVTGKVTSLSHATILAQSAGEIVSLPYALGDSVGAGQIIARFENSAQQAAVLQAQGAYDAAQSALARASGSSAANSSLTSDQAAQGAMNARTAAITSLQSMYATLDDAVHTKADTIFSNPRSNLPILNASLPDSQLTVTIQNERATMDDLLAKAKGLQNVTTTTNLDDNSTSMITDAQTVNAFITNLVAAANQAIPTVNVSASMIAGYQANFGAARNAVVGGISSLTAAKSAYDAAQSGAQVAANSASAGTNSDIASAQANVKSALGALDGAKAALEKTYIRASITGTIVSLPISRGDYVSMYSPVADISNPSALQVEIYVTADDAKTLAVNNKVKINDQIDGVIVSVAPALDPTTNKIKVVVAITGDQSSLTDGETVTASLDRIAQLPSSKKANSKLTIPIASIKVTPSGPIVFTVSSSTLVAHPIKMGAILGDQVQIIDGLLPEMDIVTDARGLSDGQTIVVNSQ